MPAFLYETHAHTQEASKCSSVSARELVGFYRDRGVEGVCITDHFFNGNTAVPANLPWSEKVDWLCMGYEHAAEEGARIGVDVFFGWEYSLSGTDFLTYGLDKAWLLRHPEVMELSVNDYCALVRSEGGLIIHAHPYREAWYIDMTFLSQVRSYISFAGDARARLRAKDRHELRPLEPKPVGPICLCRTQAIAPYTAAIAARSAAGAWPRPSQALVGRQGYEVNEGLRGATRETRETRETKERRYLGESASQMRGKWERCTASCKRERAMGFI